MKGGKMKIDENKITFQVNKKIFSMISELENENDRLKKIIYRSQRCIRNSAQMDYAELQNATFHAYAILRESDK